MDQRWIVTNEEDATHVLPDADAKPHDLKNCPCKPIISLGDFQSFYDTPLVIHNSFRDIARVDEAMAALHLV